MKKILVVTLALGTLVAGIGIGSTARGAAPAPVDPALDLELRAADAGEVLRLVGEARGRKVVVDACVKAKIDVKLKNVPASVVESALVHKLGLVATEADGTTRIGCAADVPAAK